ncbi:Annexin [Rhynchospora pubera]|uniref:Annexin n=1 Tax=Rhynchospora pubera TaxID=906938 RepID=A0AAV8DES0_9POAL|nr:Annexin [Rhynchospora pubera]KAJ4793620.1 Annexin [Rhynchospora pubera]KAJ4817453.1 Annexin [Rhynchospora pubera]
MSTLTIPHVIPSPQEDCEKLHTAFSGWGTNEGDIIEVVTHRTADQRNAIRWTYHDIYGEDLLKSLDKELTQDFEKAVLLWMLDPIERDATLVNGAVKKWAPHDRVLVEIAVTRTANELLAVRKAYQEKYKKSLEEDVAAHTTGDFRKLMVPLVSSYRYEGPEVDSGLAKSEAHILRKHIKDEEYNHEEVIRILTTRSKSQLMATFNAYHEEHGNPINKDLKKDPKDDFLFALRSIIRCITCPERYLEKVIRLSMKNTGTDENALTRVVTTRAEVNLKEIKEVYYKRNTVKLEHAIKKDTKGHYEDFLLALVGSEEE